MRDPNRLDNFYTELCQIHKKYFPDWRFGQLYLNLYGWLAKTKHVDLFFPEEDKMLEYLHEYCKDNVRP